MKKYATPEWIKGHTLAVAETNSRSIFHPKNRENLKNPTIHTDMCFHSGLVAVVDGNDAGIIDYCADSYMGYEEALATDDKNMINWMWEGTTEELLYAARHHTDLMFPDREISPEDADYDDIKALYTKITSRARSENKKRKWNK